MSTAADLRGPSADALAALRGRVDSVDTAESAGLGDELFAVAALVRSQPSLRRVATDIATEGRAKADLMRSVLDGKVSATAVDVVADGASRRWTRSRDLADTLEVLGVVAVARSAGNEVGRLADELFAVRRLVDGTPELRSALADPARTAQARGDLLTQLFADRTLAPTSRLARQAITSRHRTVSLALEAFERIVAGVHGQRVATVRAAAPLSDAELERLRSSLSRSYGRDVHLDVVVDASLLGGVRVEIGDDVIDGTVAGRLADARRKLAG